MPRLSMWLACVVAIGMTASLMAGEADKKPPAKTENKNDRAVRVMLEGKISVDFVETPLHEAIAKIGAMTGVKMLADEKLAQDKSPITLRMADTEAGKALAWVLKLADVTFTIKDGAVVIHKVNEAAEGTVPVKPAKK